MGPLPDLATRATLWANVVFGGLFSIVSAGSFVASAKEYLSSDPAALYFCYSPPTLEQVALLGGIVVLTAGIAADSLISLCRREWSGWWSFGAWFLLVAFQVLEALLRQRAGYGLQPTYVDLVFSGFTIANGWLVLSRACRCEPPPVR